MVLESRTKFCVSDVTKQPDSTLRLDASENLMGRNCTLNGDAVPLTSDHRASFAQRRTRGRLSPVVVDSDRQVRAWAVILVAVLSSVQWGSTAAAAPAGFVTVSGTGQLMLDGCTFSFAGTNNYYLGYGHRPMVDGLLDSAVALGLKVIRIWAFQNGDKGDFVVYQYLDHSGVTFNYGPDGLQMLDYAVYAAKVRGIKLIMTLVDNWREVGMAMYLSWFGMKLHDQFYTEWGPRSQFKRYIEVVITRTNVFTNTTYRDEPAIMAWELANEPRCHGELDASDNCDSSTVLAWVREMSAFIKSLDSNHLVFVGDEGFFKEPIGDQSLWPWNGNGEGGDFIGFLNVSTIDAGTFHLYPGPWGLNPDQAAQYIVDHLSAAKALNKPVIFEEYGWQDPGSRQSVYDRWHKLMRDNNGVGTLVWMLADVSWDGSSMYPDYDGYTIYRSGSAPALLSSHAQLMAAKRTCPPSPSPGLSRIQSLTPSSTSPPRTYSMPPVVLTPTPSRPPAVSSPTATVAARPSTLFSPTLPAASLVPVTLLPVRSCTLVPTPTWAVASSPTALNNGAPTRPPTRITRRPTRTKSPTPSRL